MTHGYVLPADPPGAPDRRWRCQHCQMLGTFAELVAKECPLARPASGAELLEAIEGAQAASEGGKR